MATNNVNIICPVPKFDGKMNFNSWKVMMDTFLRAQDLYVCVTNEVSEIANDNIRRHYSALSVIHQAIDQSIFHKIVNAKSAKEAYDTLEKIYMKRFKRIICKCCGESSSFFR